MRIGRYELGSVLGEGGAGTVYEAVLRGPGGLERPVALKVLHRGGSLLQREARIGGLLRHQNLVDVYEIGEAGGRWFCAMEHCALGSLTRRLPLPPRAVVEVGLQICAALAYAHAELGLVHLDIKPDNLLVAADGTVKLADLGIARAEGFELDGVRGTRGYMAPEQRAGLPVDGRADQYALGVTLIHLATGHIPGASETMSMDTLVEAETSADPALTVTVEDTLPPGAQPGPGPSWLLPAVGRCLEVDPQHRWPSAEALADALRSLTVEGPGLVEVLGLEPEAPTAGGALQPVPRPIGRDDVLDALARTLDAPGAHALLGPPGVGKSHLARSAAWRWTTDHGARGWVVDLSEAGSAADAVARVCRAVGLPPGGSGEGALVRFLRRKPSLVVLDHGDAVGSLGALAERWTQAIPSLRLLLASRRDPGLPAPTILGPLAEADAIALLVQRASERGADIAQDPQLPALARRLDGLPLALQLAAGRLGVLSVADVLERLDQGVLRAGTGDRHDTLETALQSSWEGLDDASRQALVDLTACVAGFTLEAAEAVLGRSALEPLDTLMAHSLVVRSGNRLALPAAVRAFARDRGDRSAALVRHGQHHARLGGPDALQNVGRRGRHLQRQRTLALDDLIAAAERAVDRGDGEVAEPAALAAWRVLRISGPQRRGETLLERVHRLLPDAASIPIFLGEACLRTGRPAEARGWLERGLDAARRTDDRWHEAAALVGLGRVAQLSHQVDRARARHEAAVVIHRELGAEHALATDLANLGTLRRMAGKPEEGEALLNEALARFRALDEPIAVAETLGNLAGLLSEADRNVEALALGEEALTLARQLDYRPFEGFLLGNLGEVRVGLGQLDAARADYQAALAIHREMGAAGYEGHYRVLLGDLERTEGRSQASAIQYDAAEPLLEQAEDLMGLVLVDCGRALLSDDLERAAALLAQAEARLDGSPATPAVSDRMEAVRARLQDQLR